MARTLTITTDGQVRVNEWPEGDHQLLPHLYAQIETDLVTTITLPDGKTLWADDEAIALAGHVRAQLANRLTARR